MREDNRQPRCGEKRFSAGWQRTGDGRKTSHRRAPKGAWAEVPRITEYGGDHTLIACSNRRGRGDTHASNGEAMGKQMRDGDLNRRRDAKLLVDAMRACDDASRFEFLLRLQRSYRQWPH